MPKQRFTLLILSVLLGFSRLALGLDPADLLPPEKAYHLEAKASAGVATLAWDIADGYYLYRKKFKFVSKTPGVTLGEAIFPTAGKKHDAFFVVDFQNFGLLAFVVARKDDHGVASFKDCLHKL